MIDSRLGQTVRLSSASRDSARQLRVAVYLCVCVLCVYVLF